MLDVGRVLADPEGFLELDAVRVAFQGSLRASLGCCPANSAYFLGHFVTVSQANLES